MGTASGEYLDWKRRNPDVGCLFARLLANRPEVDGFLVKEISPSDQPKFLARSIDRSVKNAVKDPNISSVTIVIPKLPDLAFWWRVVCELKLMKGWSVTSELVTCKRAGTFVAVQIAYSLKRSDGVEVLSEALFLAPFAEFPNTRKAPHAAMEIYVGQPRITDAVSGEPTPRANLAHLNARLPNQYAFDQMVANTKKSRRKSLQLSEHEVTDEDLRAKARVSFVIPTTFVQEEVISAND